MNEKTGSAPVALRTPAGGNAFNPSAPRYPSLDGLRAVSIALVMLDHASMRLSVHGGPGGVFAQGELGVTVFFVISGFLITGLLQRELDQTGRISLARFYFRRTLRIFPAYYAYVGAIGIAALLGLLNLPPQSFVAASTYTTNYCGHCGGAGGWYLAHTWSLSVEEQFYLLWPLLLLIAGRRRGGWIVMVWLVACPILRLHRLDATGVNEIRTRFELVSDAIATGCLVSLYLTRLHASPWYVRMRDRAGVLPALGAVVVASLAVHPSIVPTRLFVLVGPTVVHLLIALFLDRVVARPADATGRFLNHPAVVWIGGLSYSLYLWQQPFIGDRRLPVVVAVAVTVGCAYVSALLIERPVLRLRERIERRRRVRDPRARIPQPIE